MAPDGVNIGFAPDEGPDDGDDRWFLRPFSVRGHPFGINYHANDDDSEDGAEDGDHPDSDDEDRGPDHNPGMFKLMQNIQQPYCIINNILGVGYHLNICVSRSAPDPRT